MKRALRIELLVGIFLFSLTTLAGAYEKWDSLNLLKNVTTSKVDDGFIVRLEFEKPVGDYKGPVFLDKSVQIDFPLAFIKPAKKYFPADSSSITKVFAAQFDAETLRVRFLKKDKSDDLQDRFHLARQGRFVIVRLGQVRPVFNPKSASFVESRESDDLMTEDELAVFLARASAKIRAQINKKTLATTKLKKISTTAQTRETRKVEKVPDIKVVRAGMGVDPIVDRIKKAALPNSKAEKETQKFQNDRSKTKGNLFSLKDSRPTGKPIELIPSSLKMFSMLAVVLGIMFLLFFGFKKYVLKNTMFGGGEKLVNVLGSGFLAPKKNIVLVEVAGEVLVLGMSQDNISLLTNITDPEKIEEIKSKGGKGGSGLNWTLGNRQAEEAKASSGKAGFSNYMKQFSGTEKINKGKTVADVTAQIKQQMGRFRTARA
ncbi:MAG: flagellar biosynthetic protein FliO [Nitrospinaceae bacterium]|nr:flagellar biosynthetic protein FliO [Nitrospinaceae bacterium]